MSDVFSIDTRSHIGSIDYTPPRLSYRFLLHSSEDIDDDILRLVSFSGQSAVSQPFDYQLVLHGNEELLRDSASRDFSFQQLMGQTATVMLGAPGGTTCYNGIITSLSMAETGVFNASLKPALWKLSFANNYKVYSGTIKEVLREVLARHGIGETAGAMYHCNLDGVSGLAEARRQDWLQAGESDLEFITRLMSKVSIYYYFEHGSDRHTLVLSNRSGPGSYRQLQGPDNSPMQLYYTFSKVDSLERDDVISSFSYKQDMTVSSLRTVVAEKEAAWERDLTASASSYTSEPRYARDQRVAEDESYCQYHAFQYGTSTEEAETYATSGINKLLTSASEISGQCSQPRLKPGYTFYTVQHVAEGSQRGDVMAMRPQLDHKCFVVTSVQEQASAEGHYSTQFVATSADGQLFDFNMHGTQVGSVLARVVPPPDQTAAPQPYLHYLDKPNFAMGSRRFDSSYGESLDATGVYVVFATDQFSGPPIWVKLSENMQTVPEIGVIVTIARSNDDSELPEVQGIAQSKGNMVVIPDDATDSTNVGDSYSTSFGDNHSIAFGKHSNSDLAAARANISEQYATGKFKGVSFSQGASYSYAISENGADGVLGENISYGSSASVSHSAYSQSYSQHGTSDSVSRLDASNSVSELGVSRSESTILGKTYSRSKILGGSLPAAPTSPFGAGSVCDGISDFTASLSALAADASAPLSSWSTYNLSEVHGGSFSRNAMRGNSRNESLMEGDSISISKIAKSYSKSELTGSAPSSASSEVGSFLDKAIDSITELDSWTSYNDSKVTGDTYSNSTVTGLAKSVSSVGSSDSSSSVGTSMSNSTVGASMSNSAVGASMSNSAVGASMSNSAVGVSNQNSVTGGSYNINLSLASGRCDFDLAGYLFGKKPDLDTRVGVLENELSALKSKIVGLDSTL